MSNEARWQQFFPDFSGDLARVVEGDFTAVSFEDTDDDGPWLDLFGQAVSQLQTATFPSISDVNVVNSEITTLTTKQCSKVLEYSVSDSSRLLNLDLGGMDLRGMDLQEVNIIYTLNTVLLGRAVYRLCSFTCNGFTTDLQNTAVLDAAKMSYTLCKLNLCGINLSSVAPGLLAAAVSKLNTAELGNTDLTTEQACRVISSLSLFISTSLKHLDLSEVNLSGVPAVQLANVVSRLETVDLCRAELTTDQLEKILRACPNSITLRKVSLSYNDISKVKDFQNLRNAAASTVDVFHINDIGFDDTGSDDSGSE